MNYAKHYTKKPVTITAMQFDGTLASAQAIAEWAETKGVKNVTFENKLSPIVKCNTLESHGAPLTVSPNDFVIRGIQGEYYPCKPDIFEETYSEGEAGAVSMREEATEDSMRRGYDAACAEVSSAGHTLPDNSSEYASPGEIVDTAIKKARGEG